VSKCVRFVKIQGIGGKFFTIKERMCIIGTDLIHFEGWQNYMNITGYTVEKLKDPTGILEGDRYEFFLDIEVPEDDDLYSVNGIELKVIYAVDSKSERIAQYHIYEKNIQKVLEFELEEEEETIVKEFCKTHLEEENE
jgi:hypothetical protein